MRVRHRRQGTETERIQVANPLSSREFVGHPQDDIDHLGFRSLDLEAVQDEEDVGHDEADALVPIDERVVLDESVSVGGRQGGKIGIRLVLPSIPGARGQRVGGKPWPMWAP